MCSRVAIAVLAASLSAGCGNRTPVAVAAHNDPPAPVPAPAPLPEVDVIPAPRIASQRPTPVVVAVAPLPREKQRSPRITKPTAPAKPDPEIVAAMTQLTAAMEELRREQQLMRSGSGTADMVDVAQLRVQFVLTALAVLNHDDKGELASRKAEVELLTRRWQRAKAIYEKLAEFAEPLEDRTRELTEGKIRLARFNGDKPVLLKEHAVLIDIAERRLERAKRLFEQKLGPEGEIYKWEQVLTLERARLATVKELRMTPRRVD